MAIPAVLKVDHLDDIGSSAFAETSEEHASPELVESSYSNLVTPASYSCNYGNNGARVGQKN